MRGCVSGSGRWNGWKSSSDRGLDGERCQRYAVRVDLVSAPLRKGARRDRTYSAARPGLALGAVDGPVAADGVRIPVWSGGQQWLVSCHPPPDPPDGTPHGGEGVCVTADGNIVVISPDGTIWDLPAGRPEPGDSWEQTLRREMDEEACATVVERTVARRYPRSVRGRAGTRPGPGPVGVASRCRAPPVGGALRDRRTPCRRPGRG